MFEQLQRPVGKTNSSIDVEYELERFKKDTGVEFFALVKNKQLREQVRTKDTNKPDTDEDTLELQERYEPHLRQLCQDNNCHGGIPLSAKGYIDFLD